MTTRTIRLWPGVIIVIAQWVLYYVVSPIVPDVEVFSLPLGLWMMMAGPLGGVAVVTWWIFFSRAPWLDRIAGIAMMIVALIIIRPFVHESIAGAGQGMLLYIAMIPGLSLALVLWAALTRGMNAGVRRAALAVAMVIACVPWMLLRTSGIGGAGSEYHLRWTPTPEERLLAQGSDERLAPVPANIAPAPSTTPVPEAVDKSAAATAAPSAPPPPVEEAEPSVPPSTERKDPERVRAEWPGFRGPDRDSVIRDVHINTDWSAAPPTELWRRPIGPGWSSFAVQGDLIYTQEQRGEEEMVSCYRLSTGEPVWRHRDAARFWESNGGPGPRATPTLHNGWVYTFGATGILNVLDARSGKKRWSRDVAVDTQRRVPDWGFASSPLIVDDVVVVAAAGTLAAYDAATGNPRWQGPRYGGSYSSPHRVTIDGVDQIVLLGGPGAISVSAQDGTPLWEHKWSPGAIVQPAVTEDGDLLINAIASTGGLGTRRLHVSQGTSGWSIDERWTSNGLKPYFNDFVIHEGHAYGFDGSILASIDLEDGTRKWKGGRYGNGQLILLAEQDLLLVLSEDGELALVQATPDKFTEVARIPALNAKTWNHPVLVGDVLLVRNGEEMAAFRLGSPSR